MSTKANTQARTFCDGCAVNRSATFDVCLECVNAAQNKRALLLDRERLNWLDTIIPRLDEIYARVLGDPALYERLKNLPFRPGETHGIRAMIDILRAHLNGAVA